MKDIRSESTQYLTTEEVADKLSVHWQTVLDLIRSGMLIATKVGKSYRIDPADLDLFISQHSSKGTFRNKELFEERAKDISKVSQFSQNRLLILGSSFIGVKSVLNLFESAYEGVSQAIYDESRIRSMGWHIDPTMNDYPKPVAGNYLEYIDRARCIRVYKDGYVLAAAVMDSSFLGWGVNNREEENADKSINALAVAEFISNFFIKVFKVSEYMEPKTDDVFVSAYISNPRINKLDLQYNSFLSPSQIGDYLQSKEVWLDAQVFSISQEADAQKAAAFLWKEFCHAFGMYDQDIPLLTEDRQSIDIEAIKKKV